MYCRGTSSFLVKLILKSSSKYFISRDRLSAGKVGGAGNAGHMTDYDIIIL